MHGMRRKRSHRSEYGTRNIISKYYLNRVIFASMVFFDSHRKIITVPCSVL